MSAEWILSQISYVVHSLIFQKALNLVFLKLIFSIIVDV